MTASKKVNADSLGGSGELQRTVRVGVCAESADFAKKVSHGTSVSSFSRSAASASYCTALEMELLSIPRFVAKSPALVKAKIAVDAAAKAPSLPRLFTLRGTQQTRPRHSDNNSEHDGDRTAAKVNARPPLRVIIRAKAGIAEGYSPRLRMMSGEGAGVVGGVNAVVLKPNPVMLGPSSAGEAAAARCSLCTAARASNDHGTGASAVAVAAHGRVSCVCPDTPMCEGCLDNDDRRWSVTSGVVADDSNNDQLGRHVAHTTATTTTTTTTAPHPRNPPTSSTMHRLCGRLWTGTTANLGHRRPTSCRGADPTTRSPRTLFLVSGQGHQQQQQQQVDTNNANHSSISSSRSRSRDIMVATRRHSSTTRCEHGPRPASPAATTASSQRLATRIAKTAPPVGVGNTRLADWNYWEGIREHGGDVGDTRDDDTEGTLLSLPESSAATTSSRSEDNGEEEEEEEDCEAATTVGATAGGGDSRGGDNSSGRRVVLHVRVPRPPPTSLLILRSAC